MSNQKEIPIEEQLIEANRKINELTQRGLAIREHNEMLTASPEVSSKIALLNYELKIASQFSKSGAFPSISAEQCYVLIKAGDEMGMTPLESMNSLYIVKGKIEFHSKGMVARLTKNGYKIKFENETDKGVTVIVSHNNGFKESEIVKDTDQILLNSKAMSFAKKNKMRFHGIRQIGNFYLPHLFGSVNMWTDDDYHEVEVVEQVNPEKERAIKLINNCKSIEELTSYDEVAIEFGLTDLYDKVKAKL